MRLIYILIPILLFLVPVHSAYNSVVYGRYNDRFDSWENVVLTSGNEVAFLDANGDGYIEIYARKDTSPGCVTVGAGKCFSVYKRNAVGVYSWNHLAEIGENSCTFFVFADVNRDKIKDFVLRCTSGVWYNSGQSDGSFGTGFNRAGFDCFATSEGGFNFVDINSDGYDDYVCTRGLYTYATVVTGLSSSVSGGVPVWSEQNFNFGLNERTTGAFMFPYFLKLNSDNCVDMIIIQYKYDNTFVRNMWPYRGNCAGGWVFMDSVGSRDIGDTGLPVSITSYNGSGFNGSGGFGYKESVSSSNVNVFTNGIHSTYTIVLPNSNHLDRFEIHSVGSDSNRPWIYTARSVSNYNDNRIDRARVQDYTAVNAVNRNNNSLVENNTFSFVFDSVRLSSWTSNTYVKIPYSSHSWKINSVVRLSPSSIGYTEVSSANSVIDGMYYVNTSSREVYVGIPENVGSSKYDITVLSQLSPIDVGNQYQLTISNSPKLSGDWYVYDQGSGLSSTGCQYSIGSSSGQSNIMNWTSCPQQPTNGQTTNWAPTFSVNTDNLTQGNGNYINFKIKNVNGYESQFNGVYRVNYDSIRPVTTNNYGGTWNQNNVVVSLTCSDERSGCSTTTYCISPDTSTCTPNINLTYSGANTGTISVTCNTGQTCQKKVRFYSVDIAGNQENTNSITVKIDKQTPSTTYSISPSSPTGENTWYNSSPTITLSCSDNSGSGCLNIMYCVSTSSICTPSTTYTSSFSVTQQGNPTYIRYTSTDNINNQESVQSRNFKLDTIDPSIVNSPTVENIDSTTQRVTSASSSDSLSGVSLYRYMDSETNMIRESGSTSITVDGLTQNTKYTWSVQVRDNAGNWNSYGTATSKYTMISSSPTMSFSEIKQNSLELTASSIPNYDKGQSGYYFECATLVSGCTSSGWVQSLPYTDTGLQSNTNYSYRVKARNGDGVQTGYSIIYSKYTLSDVPKNLNHDTSQQTTNKMKWTWSSGGKQKEYYAWTTIPSSSSGWINNIYWTQYGLSPNTQYTIRVKSRNQENEESSHVSHDAYTSIQTPSGIEFGTITTSSIEVKANGILSNLGVGSSGTYIERTSPTLSNSGWRSTNPYWTLNDLDANTKHCFRSRARNGDSDNTSYSSIECKFTLANVPGDPLLYAVEPNELRVILDSVVANGNAFNTEYAILETTGNKYVQADGTLGTSVVWRTPIQWGLVHYPQGYHGIDVIGLSGNVQYTFKIKARNGDGVETGFGPSSFKYTLANPVSDLNVTATQNILGDDNIIEIPIEVPEINPAILEHNRILGNSLNDVY